MVAKIPDTKSVIALKTFLIFIKILKRDENQF